MVQDFYQLLPIPTTAEDWDAVQFVDYDGNDAAVFVFAGVSGGKMRIFPRGLNGGAQYAITKQPGGKPRTLTGEQLMAKGIPVSLKPQAAALWRISLD